MKKLVLISLIPFLLGVAIQHFILSNLLTSNDNDKEDVIKTYQIPNINIEEISQDSILANSSVKLSKDSAVIQLAKLTLQQARNYSQARRLVDQGKPLFDSAAAYYENSLQVNILDFLNERLLPSTQGVYKYDDNLVRVNNQGQSNKLKVKPSLFEDELYFDIGEGYELYKIDTVFTQTSNEGNSVPTEVVYKSLTSDNIKISKLLNF